VEYKKENTKKKFVLILINKNTKTKRYQAFKDILHKFKTEYQSQNFPLRCRSNANIFDKIDIIIFGK
jgi:hypothetical protein